MRECQIIRIDTDDPVMIWSGVGDLFVPADDVEPVGAIYSGAGEIIDFPDLQQLINGIAQRIDYTLSGVAAETFRIASLEIDGIEGRRFDVGTIQFDEDWQALGPVVWEGRLRVDQAGLESSDGGTDSDGGRIRSLKISVGSDDTGRSRTAGAAFYTDADQKIRSPDDDIFDRVALIEIGITRRDAPSDA